MSYNPDPIFRDGLNGYRKSAPPSAWERIEYGLDRRRRKSVWLKVAAGLCLLIAASTVLWQYEKTDTVETELAVSSQQSAVGSGQFSVSSQQLAASSQQLAVSSQQSTVGSEQSPNSNSIVERSRNDNLKSSRQLAVGSNQSSVSSKQSEGGNQKTFNPSDESQPITIIEPEEIITEPAPLNITEGSANDVIVEQKSIRFNYTSEEVNEKFLKKELIAEATPAKKNTSGLQKVIDKALDLTNEGTVYGELREKKNEWLSFNVLSNKTEANK